MPERTGGERNWDYRYCWIRDSIFTVWALNAVGAVSEAEGVRHFIQRAASGNADDLQVLYGVDGKRRLTEIELQHLEGWRGSRPVRIGNGAARQYQADMYGLLVEFAWQWDQLGHRPTNAYWKFLSQVVEAAIAKWRLHRSRHLGSPLAPAALCAFQGHVLGSRQPGRGAGGEVRPAGAAR